MDINRKIQASSHSGAILKVLRVKEKYIVEKRVYNAITRNKLAVKKQQNFIELITSSFNVIAIPILNLSEDNESLIIQMPYIEGIGGDAISNKGNRITAKNLKTALNSYLLNSLANSKDQKISSAILLKKINEIKKNTLPKISSFPSFIKAISLVSECCNEDLIIPIGPCHGDFTLSNMKITQDNKLYIFDFLDSYIESPLQDAVKLMQDIYYGWSFRKEKASLRLKGQLFCEVAYPNFIDTLTQIYPREMKILEIMTLLRIAPYIDESDDVTIHWLNNSLKKSLKRLEG